SAGAFPVRAISKLSGVDGDLRVFCGAGRTSCGRDDLPWVPAAAADARSWRTGRHRYYGCGLWSIAWAGVLIRLAVCHPYWRCRRVLWMGALPRRIGDSCRVNAWWVQCRLLCFFHLCSITGSQMTFPALVKNSVETIEWTPEGVVMIDQTRLPREVVYVTCRGYVEVADAIRTMIIRGAPAIGVAAAMGVAVGVLQSRDLEAEMPIICETLAKTRPTAVNLFWAIGRMRRLYESLRGEPLDAIRERLVREAQQIKLEDIAINQAIGANGAPLVPDGKTVLTHCNAGAL